MDDKARSMLTHYRKKLEERSFDEYDVYSFLIFIRSYIINDNDYPVLIDFCHLIAHRERNRGKVCSIMESVVNHGYKLNKENNILESDEKKILYEEWQKEWKKLADNFSISLNEETILEITMCICSLMHKTNYTFTTQDGKKHSGAISIFVRGTSYISMAFRESTPQEGPFWVGVFDLKLSNVDCQHFPFILSDVVEAVREDGKLRLKTDRGYLV